MAEARNFQQLPTKYARIALLVFKIAGATLISYAMLRAFAVPVLMSIGGETNEWLVLITQSKFFESGWALFIYVVEITIMFLSFNTYIISLSVKMTKLFEAWSRAK